MQGGVIGGVCLLAFLLSICRTEELDGLKELQDRKDVAGGIRDAKEIVDLKELSESEVSDDLKNDIRLAVTESNSQDDEERSGAMAHSISHNFGGSSMSKAVAHSYNGGSAPAFSDGYGRTSQSKATAVAGEVQVSPISPFNPELSPFVSPASGLSQAEALAISNSGGSYGQGLNSYPYSPPYPYSSGSTPAKAQAVTDSGFYQPAPIATPLLSPYNQVLNSAQAQPQVSDGFYELIQRPIPSPIISSYNQGLSTTQIQTHVDNGLYQPGVVHATNSNPYNQGLSPAQANRESYQPIVEPISLVPQPAPRFKQSNTLSDFPAYPYSLGLSSTQVDSVPYQPVPIPDPSIAPYEQYLVPYKESSSAQTKVENDTVYKSIPIHNSSPLLVSYRGPDTVQAKTQAGSNDSQSNTFTYNLESSTNYPNDPLRSGNNNPALEDASGLNLTLKTGWDSFAYSPYTPSGPNSKIYTSGAEAARAYADSKTGAAGVESPYSQGLSSYSIDYPLESPYRPEGFNLNEAQGHYNVFSSGQTSPIVFKDAKSRLIFPYEYVFPNKMPGGENVIQCTKENEFHHFWSRGLDCLVCICLNEYGLLTPVCASCSGCDNPPPKLPEPFPRPPESITVRPATPEPFESIPVIPIPVPQPEPRPPETDPIPELYQPVHSPEPYPWYPESIPPSPVPVPYPEPIATLPPPHPGAMCNPLPSGQPFTNPLHPCQICICRESYAAGKPDVQIECKENPQCIAPADVTTLPPIPDVPVPIPLPICEKFPEHVLFPHPTDTCKLCKCSKSLAEDGVPEQHITCYPHPDCVPKLEPVTEPSLVPPPLPIPIEPQQLKPYPEPEPTPVVPLTAPFIPMEPVPLPEIVTVEPLPWPPITTIAPSPTTVPIPVLTPRPGPLPGPSPHESCRPYPPNQAFQHPWDECQLCLCTEAFAVGMITVEVNCYTKPSCCIEPPDDLKPGYSKPYTGSSNVVNGPEIQALSSGPQPSVIMTSSHRPPSIFSSYSSRPVNIYDPGSSQGSNVDTQPQRYPPGSYNRLPSEDTFGKLPSSYTYQPSYQSGYVNPQYSDYPRLPAATMGSYKPSSYGYRGTYPYRQEDAVGNAYPGTQGHYKPYDPRYPGVSPSNAYPAMYQRHSYDIPPIYPPGQIRDSYEPIQMSALSGSNAQSVPQTYLGNRIMSKSGNDGPEDVDDSQ